MHSPEDNTAANPNAVRDKRFHDWWHSLPEKALGRFDTYRRAFDEGRRFGTREALKPEPGCQWCGLQIGYMKKLLPAVCSECSAKRLRELDRA